MTRIVPAVMCGGVGSRLWPMSRALYPKQLLPLTGERTMLQETVGRVSDESRFAPPILICNDEHRFLIGAQLQEAGTAHGGILLEPAGRNTARWSSSKIRRTPPGPGAGIAASSGLGHGGRASDIVGPLVSRPARGHAQG